ncbi:hypothetical protein OUZ56_006174 [Daphnia magna]|uniref:Uncharacterized protein n=1 Tax=Daphnia magna TaxID=35525 RepID=A0ABQ9YUX0_9CRUS|nr:hypothetical protein OUZ56_006174 [Daphnia magna]
MSPFIFICLQLNSSEYENYCFVVLVLLLFGYDTYQPHYRALRTLDALMIDANQVSLKSLEKDVKGNT